MLSRVTKTTSILYVSQLVNLISQAILPPLFLGTYGAELYGNWITLSAGVAWLGSLDLGLQTYVANRLTLEYAKGDIQSFRLTQSVLLRVSLGVATLALLLSATLAFTLPLGKLLGLKLPATEAAVTTLLLAAQILIGTIWGQLNATFRAVLLTHRGAVWGTFQGCLMLATTSILVSIHSPLWAIASGQLFSYLVASVASIVDLRRSVPSASPTLALWNPQRARESIMPSLLFGSFTVSNFLAFQVPILALANVCGPTAAVGFSLARTYCGVIRQVLGPVRNSMRPELARLSATRSSIRLQSVYSAFASISMAVGVVATSLMLIGAIRFVPWWTGRGDVFDSATYLAMAVATLMVVAKDTELELPFSTNQHRDAALICLLGYASAALVFPVGARLAGPPGVIGVWAICELSQTLLISRSNSKQGLQVAPSQSARALTLGTICLALAYFLTLRLETASTWVYIATMATAGTFIMIAAAATFGLRSHLQTMIGIVSAAKSPTGPANS